jgi:hypothetical protein
MRHLLFSFCVFVTSCASAEPQPFDIHDGYVRYTNLAGSSCRVTGADPTTFQLVAGSYGKDRLHVFYTCDRLEGADPTSFVAVGKGAGRDARSVFFRDKACADCDVQTFRSLAEDWYADKNTAYLSRMPVPGVDIASFKRLNSWFAKDARRVYISGEAVPGADAPSFKLESCGQSEVNGEDKNRCYWYEHAVPCDCKPREGGSFAGPMTVIPPGTGLIVEGRPVSINLHELANQSALKAVLHGMSAGYWPISSGRHTLPLECRNRGVSERMTAMVDVEAGGLYRLTRREGTTCEAEVARPAMVQGRVDGPEVQIVSPKDPTKRLSQLELPAGSHTLTAVCRYVTRSAVKEARATIALQLEAGRIYQLAVPSGATENACNVRADSLAIVSK